MNNFTSIRAFCQPRGHARGESQITLHAMHATTNASPRAYLAKSCATLLRLDYTPEPEEDQV